MEQGRRVEPEHRSKFGVWTMFGIISTLLWVVGTVLLVAWTNWDNLQQQRFFCSDLHWGDFVRAASASWHHHARAFVDPPSCDSIRIVYREQDRVLFLQLLLLPPASAWIAALALRQALRFSRRINARMTTMNGEPVE